MSLMFASGGATTTQTAIGEVGLTLTHMISFLKEFRQYNAS